MPRNEDGEFELVLGNRQLVSVFLIIVILLGVFFSMGYIVGRNCGPAVTAENRNPTSKPIVVERPASEPSSPSPSAAPPAETAAAEDKEKPSPLPPTSTHPVETAPSPKTESKADRSVPPARAKQEKPAEPATPPVTGEPTPGEYWQVVATSRPDAEIISEALAKKGFKAMLAPAPREGLFRVLVGPFKDSAAMAQTRSDLEAAGFRNPLVRKY